MALGKDHDKATQLWSVPFGLIVGIFLGMQSGLISGLSFGLGGFWLSPDLDTHSNASRRWGVLQSLWCPYRKIFPHRSLFSHGPFIGTTIRIIYLISIVTCFSALSSVIGLSSSAISIEKIFDLINSYPQQTLAIMLGLEGSAWLHLIQDRDPMPAEWHRWKQK